ncbi:MAG: U32 family peptidase [Lachnospiraceae bacterium]|nr:U32 family peptidase [Lachnospiraceae bacterium]
MNRKVELLVPAGSLEVLKIAIMFGADAVYIGGEEFSLRAKAANFSDEDMIAGIDFAHKFGKKVYVTVNIFAHNYDMDEAVDYLKRLNEIKPDGLIMSDPGLISLAFEYAPNVEVHISTQANNTNYMTYKFWYKMGVKRVVSARELSLEEIKGIRENIPEDMEIESFIHGAMCISYSGRCLLSNYFTGRDANRGECTHPCRWQYAVMEEQRPGEYLPVYENERGTYIFNSKDLCMIGHIPEMIDAGIDSFKIEGRMKTSLYVATVARTYRKAIDDYYKSIDTYKANMDWYMDEISKCTYRKFTTGFYFGKPNEETQIYDSNTYISEYIYLGFVEEIKNGKYRITQRNKFLIGDEIEIMKPGGENVIAKVINIEDEEGNVVPAASHAKQTLYITLSEKADEYDIFRVHNKDVKKP